ncbi:MAG: hypothetical protein WA902_07485 [Thermosynechococcaceae cyanobacterium]
MARTCQKRQPLDTTRCSALPPRLGGGLGRSPKDNVYCTTKSAPNRLRGHGLNAAEPIEGMRSHLAQIAERRAGVPKGLQESRCVVPWPALLLVAAHQRTAGASPRGADWRGGNETINAPLVKCNTC